MPLQKINPPKSSFISVEMLSKQMAHINGSPFLVDLLHSKTQSDHNIHNEVVTLLMINEENEKRQLNIIVHYVSELTSEDSLTRTNHEIDFVNKMCQSQFNTKVY